jgi:hypothetical protein
MELFTTATYSTTHPIFPFTEPSQTLVAASGEISGKNKDSGEHAEIPLYALTGLSRFNKEQLAYVQQIDLFNEAHSSDPYDQQWKPTYIYKHRVTNHKGIRHVLVKVGGMFENPSWIDKDPLQLHNPFLLVEYALWSSLRNHKDFKWVSEYTDLPT